jgi:hypothetical protein
MDIWAFTMSRLLTSMINALFLFVVSKYCFKLTKNELMPDKEDIAIILKNLIVRHQMVIMLKPEVRIVPSQKH